MLLVRSSSLVLLEGLVEGSKEMVKGVVFSTFLYIYIHFVHSLYEVRLVMGLSLGSFDCIFGWTSKGPMCNCSDFQRFGSIQIPPFISV